MRSQGKSVKEVLPFLKGLGVSSDICYPLFTHYPRYTKPSMSVIKSILKRHIGAQANYTLKACVVRATDLRVCFLSRLSYISGGFLPDLPCGAWWRASIEVIAND